MSATGLFFSYHCHSCRRIKPLLTSHSWPKAKVFPAAARAARAAFVACWSFFACFCSIAASFLFCVRFCSKCEFMDTIRGRAWLCERTTHPAFLVRTNAHIDALFFMPHKSAHSRAGGGDSPPTFYSSLSKAQNCQNASFSPLHHRLEVLDIFVQ